MTGFSVITHYAACDTDRRSIAQLIGSDLGSRYADLSFPGQSVFEGFNFARLATRNPDIRDLVVMLSLPQLSSRERQDLRSQVFFRIVNGPSRLNSIGHRLLSLQPITAGETVEQDPWTYKNRRYPGYGELKTEYLLPEQLAQKCPEVLGQNRDFIEALYWNNYLHGPIEQDYLADLEQIAREARAADKRLLVVLLPIDFEDIATLNRDMAKAIASRRDQLLSESRGSGLDIVDLSDALPAQAYSDRWCGCGHLNQTGRQAVAARVVAALRSQN